MNTYKKILLFFLAFTLSFVANANEWVNNVKVTQLGTYQHSEGHFVWLSQLPGECSSANPANPVLNFSESSPGGKALLSVLIAAVMSKANVSVQVNGCDIIEIYLKGS